MHDLCKFEHVDDERTINTQSSLSRDFRTCTFSIESSTRVIYRIFVVTYPNMNSPRFVEGVGTTECTRCDQRFQ